MNTDMAFIPGTHNEVCPHYGQSSINTIGDRRYCGWAVATAADVRGAEPLPYPDLGGRVLALAAKEQINDFATMGEFHHGHALAWLQGVAHAAEVMGRVLGVGHSSMRSSLLVATTDFRHQFRVAVAGEGTVVAVRFDGELEIQQYWFPGGEPLVPSVLTDRRAAERFAGKGKDTLRARWATIHPAPTLAGPQWVEQSLMFDVYPYHTRPLPRTVYRAVMVFSNEIGKLKDATSGAAVPIEDAVRHFVTPHVPLAAKMRGLSERNWVSQRGLVCGGVWCDPADGPTESVI